MEQPFDKVETAARRDKRKKKELKNKNSPPS